MTKDFKIGDYVYIDCGEGFFKGVGTIIGQGIFYDTVDHIWYVERCCNMNGFISGIYAFGEKYLRKIPNKEYEAAQALAKFAELLK